LADKKTAELASVTMMKNVTAKSAIANTAPFISVKADGQDSVVIKAQVQDKHGNTALQGMAVKWKTSLGSLSASETQTDAHGIATVRLTSQQAGDAQVTAVLSGKEKAAPTQARFMPGELSAAHSLVTISKNQAVTGEDVQITFTPKDRYGNTLTDNVEAITLVFTPNLGISPHPPSFKKTENGSYSAAFHATKVGQTAIAVNVGTLRMNKSLNLTVVADSAKPQAADEQNPFTLSKKGIAGVLKGSDSVTVDETVIYAIALTDAHGNPLGKDIQTDWSIAGIGWLNYSRVFTDNNGVARVALSSQNIGTASVTVTLPGGKVYTQDTVFTHGKLNPATSTVTLSKPSIIADGKETTTLTVKLFDTPKNAIPGQAAQMKVTASAGAGITIPA
ncbi:hypothetical protein FE392_04950, partial [Xenorhabdus sp. 12]